MMCYKKGSAREREKKLFRRAPVKGTHGKIVVITLANGELLLKVGKRIELMGSVKLLIVFAVAALNLSIVSWRIGTNKLVTDTKLCESGLKESGFVFLTGDKTVGELGTIVCLNTLNEEWEFLHTMADKLSGRIGTVFLKGFQIAKTAELIDEGILEIPAILSRLANEADFGDELHVNLYPLAWIPHLLVGLWDVLGIRRLYRHLAVFFKEPVQAGYGACVSSLTQFYPEYHQSGVGISPPHILY